MGQILQALREEGIDENTLVVFTSDNGPWHIFKTHGGTAGMLRGAKGGTFEGGMRVPTILRWPGKIKPGVIMDMATTMDLFPTFCKLSNTILPVDRVYDGYDISPLIFGTGTGEREEVFYYRGQQLYAVRLGNYKAHFITRNEYSTKTAHPITDPAVAVENSSSIQDPPLLYNLNTDPSEKFNLADGHPEIIAEIIRVMKIHLAGIEPVENQLEK